MNRKKRSRLLAAALFSLAFATHRAEAAELAFTPAAALTNGESVLRLTVPAGAAARVDASTNLVDWSGFLTAGPASLVHTDVFAPFASTRYYRAEQLAAGALTGDHIQTADGDLVIHPITHASFLMTWKGLAIYNDPDTASYTGLPKANLILVSHDHTDHWDQSTITAIKTSTTVIIASNLARNQFETVTRGQTIVLANGASTNILGIQIDAIPAYNSNHPKGSGNGYVLTLGGKRIYMSGDTGDIPETRALQNIDVAFLCMNIPFTMTINQAAAVTRAFQPKIVYPYHFRNGDNTFANLNSFKAMVGTDFPIEVRLRKWY